MSTFLDYYMGIARIRYGDGGAEGNDTLGAVIYTGAGAEIDVLRRFRSLLRFGVRRCRCWFCRCGRRADIARDADRFPSSTTAFCGATSAAARGRTNAARC